MRAVRAARAVAGGSPGAGTRLWGCQGAPRTLLRGPGGGAAPGPLLRLPTRAVATATASNASATVRRSSAAGAGAGAAALLLGPWTSLIRSRRVVRAEAAPEAVPVLAALPDWWDERPCHDRNGRALPPLQLTEEQLRQLRKALLKLDAKLAAAKDQRPRIAFWRKWLRLTWLCLLFVPLALTYPLAALLSRTVGLFSFSRKKDPLGVWAKWWVVFRFILERGGASTIKFGQWMGTRRDLFPDGLAEELSKLHSVCPSHSLAHTKAVLERRVGGMERIFSEFSEQPTASGAIGQVHRARLVPELGGEEVAVKIRHPMVDQNVWIDLEFLGAASRFIEWLIPSARYMALNDCVAQFSVNMLCQLDFRLEAQHLLRFSQNFRRDRKDPTGFSANVVIPRCYEQFASPELVIMSFEEGTMMSHWLKPWVSRKDKQRLAKIGLDTYLQMMLKDHYIHADLHPGNLLVRRKGQKDHVPHATDTPDNIEFECVLLDVGLVTELSPDDATHFVDLFKAVVAANGKAATELMIKHSRETPEFASEEEHEAFVNGVAKVFTQVVEQPLGDLDVGAMLRNILSQFQKHHVLLEGNFSTLMLGTVVLEGVGRELDPEINLILASIPFLFKNTPHHMLPKSVQETMANIRAAKRIADAVVEKVEKQVVRPTYRPPIDANDF